MSEPIDATTVNSGSFAVTIDGVGTVIEGTYVTVGAEITFTPDAPLPSGTTIDIRINANLKDLAGNTATTHNSHFTTAN